MPIAPATTTIRSVIAHLAWMVRCAGIVYIVAQVLIWHGFYTADPWRLAGPALAVAWAVTMAARLRRGWPSLALVGADAAVYAALALGAVQCVPPSVRDDPFSWLVIAMTGQLIVAAWYAPGALALLLTLSSPLAYWAGALLWPVTNAGTLMGAAMTLAIIGLLHTLGRRAFYASAAAADATLEEADQAASEQYVILTRTIERREHERLLHDTVLNTLTALARPGDDDLTEVVTRCRGDVRLIEGALGGREELAAGTRRASGDLLSEVRAVVAEMRARRLTVHVDAAADAGALTAVPDRVTTAIASAAREALSNVAAHAGTDEAWVTVRLTARAGEAETPCRLEVTVRDRGVGFDLAQADSGRLGLRRSITERTADCGGRASVWSAPGQGAVVRLSWPAAGQPGSPAPAGPIAAGRLW